MTIPEEMVPKVTAEHEREDVLVSFAEGYTPEQLTAAIEASGCTLARPITEEDVEAGFATLKVTADYDVEHAMTQLGMLPELEGAQPNFIYHLAEDMPTSGAADLRARLTGAASLVPGEIADDPLAAHATEINDPKSKEQWALDSINAYRAWDTVRTNGEVTVAVFDNGFRIEHEDLSGNVIASAAYNSVEESSRTDVLPSYGYDNANHGSHVAGIIAAEANNGLGIAGVSYNARILPVKVFSTASNNKLEASTLSLCRAYDYILDHASEYSIKVVSMSVGGTFAEGTTLDGSDKALIERIDSAYSTGILTVCSAGNDAVSKGGAYFNYPSDWADNALGVIALQKGSNGSAPNRAGYSNYNRSGQMTKDISAPGSSIYSMDITSDSAYAYKNGTSMAAPCVSGVAALVYAAKPDATAAQVADIICSTANKINESDTTYDARGFSLEYGYGEVDAEAAVLKAKGAYLGGEASLLVSATMELVPTNLDATQIHGDWTWSSSDESVATVEGGVVTGKASGYATITAQSGNVKLTKDITVYAASFTGHSTLTYGSTAEIPFVAAPAAATWNLSTSDKAVVSVSQRVTDGMSSVRVQGAQVGTATLTATLSSNPSVKVSRSLTVEPADIANAAIAPVGNQVYAAGAAVEPKPAITFKGAVLVEGRDYTLAYENNLVPNVEPGGAGGDASPQPVVIIKGMGNFTGEARARFDICKKDIADCEIELARREFTYSGEQHKPAVTVTSGGIGLTQGVDYELEYEQNVNAGQANVVVRGVGGFGGSAQASFTIVPASVEAPKGASNLIYNGKSQVGVTAAASAPYVVNGNRATNAGTYAATVALKDTRNYCWADGTTSNKSIPWSINPKQVVPIVTLNKTTFTYSGVTQRPAILSVKDRSFALVSSDYSITWPSGSTNVGTYRLEVTCKGNYTGKGYATYRIEKASVTAPTAMKGLVYTGSKQTGVKSVASAPYKLSGMTAATNAGTYEATAALSDTDNYQWADGTTASKVISWRINAVSLVGVKSKGAPAYRYYTGKALRPPVSIAIGSKTLESGKDYTLAYAGNKEVGVATITVKGRGNYTGTTSVTFNIVGKPRFAGATKMPVKSKATYSLKNCTLKVLDGANVITVSGSTITAKAAGTAHVGIYDEMGVLVKKRAVKVYKLSGKTRLVKTALDKRYALTVKEASKAAGASICLLKAKSGDVFRFKFALKPDGTYTLKNRATGMLVSVKSSSKAAGANVVQQKAVSGKASQRWRITVDANNRIVFTNKASGKALGVAGGKAANKRNVAKYDSKTATAQKWVLAT